jgi:hypothetical protein
MLETHTWYQTAPEHLIHNAVCFIFQYFFAISLFKGAHAFLSNFGTFVKIFWAIIASKDVIAY